VKTEQQIERMDRKQFRAYALSLPPKQAEEARRIRHRIRVRNWHQRDTERARQLGLARWHEWRAGLTKEREAEHRAKDAERKRRERAKAKRRARS
jgi:hypothetical protein